MDNKDQVIGSGRLGHSKRNYILIGAILLIAAVSLLVWWFFAYRQSTSIGKVSSQTATSLQAVKAESVCTNELISEANAPIANSDQVSLGAAVDKITSLKDYDHDPNCLYIVLQYSLASGNAAQSSTYLTNLQQVYDPNIGYSSAFTINLVSLSVLSQNVSFLVQNTQASAANSAQGDSSTAAGSTAADKFHAGQK